MTHKYAVGQIVNIVSRDRSLTGKPVKIIALGTGDERHYKVSGDFIRFQLSFFENQLEAA